MQKVPLEELKPPRKDKELFRVDSSAGQAKSSMWDFCIYSRAIWTTGPAIGRVDGTVLADTLWEVDATSLRITLLQDVEEYKPVTRRILLIADQVDIKVFPKSPYLGDIRLGTSGWS